MCLYTAYTFLFWLKSDRGMQQIGRGKSGAQSPSQDFAPWQEGNGAGGEKGQPGDQTFPCIDQ